MCCFTGPVKTVNRTRIFARAAADGVELLAYQMEVQATAELAMVLPLPVKPGSGEQAVRFIDLHGYPEFFSQLDLAFPQPRAQRSATDVWLSAPTPAPTPLEIHNVGSFEASYVPTIADFARLDARFRFPAGVWDQLPGYKSYGFAVFKLKPGARIQHPMAFSFPRADPKVLFFPTYHIHDGRIHATATYDHALYCQAAADEPLVLTGWEESTGLLSQSTNVNASQGLFDATAHAYRRNVVGSFKNLDVLVNRA